MYSYTFITYIFPLTYIYNLQHEIIFAMRNFTYCNYNFKYISQFRSFFCRKLAPRPHCAREVNYFDANRSMFYIN